MLKTIALAGLFVFTSAVSTAATTSTPEKKDSSTQSAPKGFCHPLGVPC
jgi:hypothetical protein